MLVTGDSFGQDNGLISQGNNTNWRREQDNRLVFSPTYALIYIIKYYHRQLH